MEEKGFKVVYEAQDGLFSFWQFANEGGVFYEIGKKTKPKKGNGPLCVFKTYEDALAYVRCLTYPGIRHYTHIYSCTYEPSKERKIWFWCVGLGRVDSDMKKLPVGTALVGSVTLLERVEKDEI